MQGISNRYRSALIFAALSIPLCIQFPAQAQQAWPSKPVKVITATATGGTLDITARLFAEQMARVTGQSWVIENRTGGLGIPGTVAAARAAPDGYTFFVGSTENFVLTPKLQKDVPYDPAADFVHVAVLIDTTAFAIAVNSDVPAKNLRELIALAKSQPGKLSYAVTGSTADMIGRWINKQAGIEVEQIFYKAVAQSIPDVSAGRVHYTINALPPMEPLIKTGKLRVLAMTSATRLPGWDSVETVNETIPGLFLSGLLALSGPTGIPLEIQRRVNQEASLILTNTNILQKSSAYGWFNRQPARSLQETGDFVRVERERWNKVIDGLGIKPN
jgi:tripartite-type tricarboxylate transporter receptor subunit TctC